MLVMESNLLSIALLGFGGGLLGLLGIFRRSWTKSWAFRAAPLALAAAVGALALSSDKPALAWLPLGLAAFWALLNWGDGMLVVVQRALNVLRRPALACGSLLVVGPMLALLWSYAATSPPDYWEAPKDFLEDDLSMIQKAPIEQHAVRTDAGRLLEVKAPVRAASVQEIAAANKRTTLDTISTNGAGVDYNCHGWVFAGGRYWIGGKQVQTILDDNGYFPVDCPEAGDIIVYRNRSNDVLHTGLVRVADEWGILIESKWGSRGRYVHTPENQGYSLEYTYYRSARGGHLLSGINSMSPQNAVPTATSSGDAR
jgi:hypothetical protein